MGDPNSPNYIVVFLGASQANKNFLERNAASILGLQINKMWSHDLSNNFDPEDGSNVTSKLEAL
jgi:hypothetical protein